jgi:hypothetical protein
MLKRRRRLRASKEVTQQKTRRMAATRGNSASPGIRRDQASVLLWTWLT